MSHKNEGVSFAGSNAPDIRNCIIWHNNVDGGYAQMTYGCSALFSCVTDVYDPNGVAEGSNDPNESGNISCNPGFAYDYGKFGYYHLRSDSECIDRGDSGSYTGEIDIDADNRVLGTKVDMGADEYDPDCSDTSSESDFNGDGLVNYEEFEYFSLAWLSHDPTDPAIIDPNHPSYNPDLSDPNSASYIHPNVLSSWDVRCDLDSDYTVDIYDLAIFLDDWLWMACWRSTSGAPEMLVVFGGEEMASSESMMMMPMSMGISEEAIGQEPDPYDDLTDKELSEQAESLIEMLDFLIEVGLDEDVEPENVEAIMDDIAEMLDDMQAEWYLRDEKDK